jgi:NADH-quinone oxidoreductase subunit J
MDALLFYVFGALALLSGVVVVTQRNPATSAFALVVSMCSLAVIFGLLGSPFIAALQVIVYAGAIMVLFLFVIMLLNAKEEAHPPGTGRGLKLAALALAATFLLQVGATVLTWRLEPRDAFDASTQRMAQVLFSVPYLYVFEATSILILAALVGSVALAKKDLS